MLRHRLAFAALLMVAASGARAQQSSGSIPNIPLAKPTEVLNWAWTIESWTGDERPYAQIARNTDTAVAKGKSLDALAKKYEAAAKAHPTDSKAQYAWGYAAVVARKPGYVFKRRLLSDIDLALANARPPQTYRYARLRYTVMMRWRASLFLKGLGKRLLIRNPNDYLVKLHQIQLIPSGSPAERRQALTYAQDLVRAQPNRASSYSALAYVYDDRLIDNKSIADGDKAIAAHRKVIQLTQNNEEWRNWQRHLIQVIQKEQARLRKQGARG